MIDEVIELTITIIFMLFCFLLKHRIIKWD